MTLPQRTTERAPEPGLADLLDPALLQRLADASHAANGVPIEVIDARDGEVLAGCGRQDICACFHRAHPESLARCREGHAFVARSVSRAAHCEHVCGNGLRDMGVPIVAEGRLLATMFRGQFFYEGESPDRDFFVRQGRRFGWDEREYLAALDRVPVLSRDRVADILAYDVALARFVSDLATCALSHTRSERALRDEDARRSEFLGVLSHELRNPLAPIRNALVILDQAPPGGEQARRARAVIGRQVDHLTRLVDDLLDATRISRGRIELHRSVVDLGELVERTVEDHRPLFAGRGVALEVASAPRVLVDADPTRIAQAIGNLLQNGAKFTPRGGRVSVEVAPAGGRVRVSVRDTGVGIGAAMLESVFEPFTQADDTLHRSMGGLGLGLALVKGIVELHGGRVEARSEGPDRGAQVSFELAVAAGPPGGGSAAAEPVGVPSRRVLVIEDNADSAETLRELLELAGHEVELARDGAEGLAKARALLPDVVLCDIGLPVMDGYQVARAIRALPSLAGTTLVALTGYALPEDQRLAAEAGFAHHLAKPAPLEEIERVIAGATRRPR